MTDLDSLSATLGRHYVLATDGGCAPNPGLGGWAYVKQLREGPKVLGGKDTVFRGRAVHSTNNRMELTAALRGLLSLQEQGIPVAVVTDSTYLRDGLTSWLPNWKRRGWRTSARKPVENRDLWEALDAAAEGLELHWLWVAGHSGHGLNERADAAATAARTDRSLPPEPAYNAHGFTAE